jgi:hypothetical protein
MAKDVGKKNKKINIININIMIPALIRKAYYTKAYFSQHTKLRFQKKKLLYTFEDMTLSSRISPRVKEDICFFHFLHFAP